MAYGTQKQVHSAIIKQYGANEVETVGAVTYVGKENLVGAWLIQKIDTTSNVVISYATIKNNTTTTSYTAAWTARAALTYGDFSEVF